jgi:N-acetyl-anhydromuramyl-L-alanine amidase AmpD
MPVWNELVTAYRSSDAVSDELKVGSLAQWILESGRGESALAQEHLNFGGLKFRQRMVGYADPVDYRGSDGELTTYCKFASIGGFIDGYWHFISSGPYTKWKDFSGSASRYVKYLAETGYAVDPAYVPKVVSVIPEARELLGIEEEAEEEDNNEHAGAPRQPNWTSTDARYLNDRATPVLGIVLHDTAGAGTHNDTLYLTNPQDGRRVSVDFTVERDGSIWKLNPDLRAFYCNHAGRETSWRGFRNRQVNAVTVGIEIVQKSDLSLQPLYPDAQIGSVAALCAWLTSTFGLQASDIITHRQIITDGSRSDPRKFPFDTPNGFWKRYWDAYGRGDQFVSSMNLGSPNVIGIISNAA